MSNQIHMPTGTEALEHCQKRLPRFKWRIRKDVLEEVYLEGIFNGKILNLYIYLDIRPEGTRAWITQKTPSPGQKVLCQLANETGIPYGRALADVTDTLIDLVRDAHDLGLDSVIHTAGPLA